MIGGEDGGQGFGRWTFGIFLMFRLQQRASGSDLASARPFSGSIGCGMPEAKRRDGSASMAAMSVITCGICGRA
jgi:hypothetical protein